MRMLISGICGFVGSTLARGLARSGKVDAIRGLDNLIRPGSATNLEPLRQDGFEVEVADIRDAQVFDRLSQVDWVLDAAALPSVLAGVDGKTGSRELIEHNLYGTVNMLEYCKRTGAGFVLLSTSRVYSIAALAQVKVQVSTKRDPDDWPGGPRFVLDAGQVLPPGVSCEGISETCSTTAPVSLYGTTKVASEQLALEYAQAFGFPVWINRCGVLAGAGQFGKPDQGIFSYWIHSWSLHRPLAYIGFGGTGHQVRDCLHPLDLLPVLLQQMVENPKLDHRVFNLAGGLNNVISLAELSAWCVRRFGHHEISVDMRERVFDLPWIVLDCGAAQASFGFHPQLGLDAILGEIAHFAESRPDWLDLSEGGPIRKVVRP
jgi:CDP-paratose 2-epimerase